MSNRIDLPLLPSHAVAFLCASPWLLLTALVVLLAENHGLAVLILSPFTFAGAVFQYCCSGLLKGAGAVTSLRIDNGQLYARLRSGSEYAVVPASESRVSSRFAVLKLHHNGSISHTYPVVLVVLTPRLRNTPPEAFRQLRVWLRLGSSFKARKTDGQQSLNAQEIH